MSTKTSRPAVLLGIRRVTSRLPSTRSVGRRESRVPHSVRKVDRSLEVFLAETDDILESSEDLESLARFLDGAVDEV